jgi:hypothetical protein
VLRGHGVNALHVDATPLPGSTTVSLLGEVVGLPEGGATRTRIQVYQGAGRNARLVAELESSAARPGLAGPVMRATVEAEARRTAEALADRIGQYYRRQGWPWR